MAVDKSGVKPPDLPIAVTVLFDAYSGPTLSDGTVPNCPLRRTCSMTDANSTRLQLPLKLAWAITIHKAQGLTLDSVVVDVGKKEFSSDLSFVACSHVRTMTHLLLHPPFSFQHLANLSKSRRLQERKLEDHRLSTMEQTTINVTSQSASACTSADLFPSPIDDYPLTSPMNDYPLTPTPPPMDNYPLTPTRPLDDYPLTPTPPMNDYPLTPTPPMDDYPLTPTPPMDDYPLTSTPPPMDDYPLTPTPPPMDKYPLTPTPPPMDDYPLTPMDDYPLTPTLLLQLLQLMTISFRLLQYATYPLTLTPRKDESNVFFHLMHIH